MKPDDIQRFFVEAWIGAEVEGPQPARLEIMLDQCAMNGVTVDSKTAGETADAPTPEAGFRWRWSTADDAIADLRTRRGLDGFFRTRESRSVGSRVWLPATTR